jgi:hypothetical protein
MLVKEQLAIETGRYSARPDRKERVESSAVRDRIQRAMKLPLRQHQHAAGNHLFAMRFRRGLLGAHDLERRREAKDHARHYPSRTRLYHGDTIRGLSL